MGACISRIGCCLLLRGMGVEIVTHITQILAKIEQGDSHASEHLLPFVYDELRKLAKAKLAQEEPGQTLQPTALVHDAYIRLVDVDVQQHWNNRGHFFAAAAEAMRRILVENARAKQRLKRGGDRRRVELDEELPDFSVQPNHILVVDEALDGLADQDARAAEVVRLHYFAGFKIEEAAELLGISHRTAYRDWEFARAWLARMFEEIDLS